jgi:hypothetical protein
LDCFHIGRLAGTKRRVWQYTATDVHSGYLWGELHVIPISPSGPAHQRARPPRRARAGCRRVETENRLDRQRQRVQSLRYPIGARSDRCAAALHPCRPVAVQRCGREGPADRAAGVPAGELRALARAEVHRGAARPRALPAPLQLRASAPRPVHERPRARRRSLWFAESQNVMRRICRHISVAVQARACRSPARARDLACEWQVREQRKQACPIGPDCLREHRGIEPVVLAA